VGGVPPVCKRPPVEPPADWAVSEAGPGSLEALHAAWAVEAAAVSANKRHRQPESVNVVVPGLVMQKGVQLGLT
jgi:hypothetical protein